MKRDNGIEFKRDLSPAAARSLLGFGFSERDHARMAELSHGAQLGKLTSAEQQELDTFERLGCVLDILHSRAGQVLKKKSKTAS